MDFFTEENFHWWWRKACSQVLLIFIANFLSCRIWRRRYLKYGLSGQHYVVLTNLRPLEGNQSEYICDLFQIIVQKSDLIHTPAIFVLYSGFRSEYKIFKMISHITNAPSVHWCNFISFLMSFTGSTGNLLIFITLY